MSSIDKSIINDLLTNGQKKSLIGGKQLTLAFSGLYIAQTTLKAKPLLVWEGESPYARYYVPIESLHPSIKAKIGGKADGNSHSNGNSHGAADVKLEVVETLKGKGADSEAVIEKLTVGERSTSWVRFTEGPLMGFVRFERSEIDEWFENGAIFAGIKNPYKRIDTTPIASHIVVKIDGAEVAETNAAVLLNETGLKDAYYLPATSIKDWSMMERSDWRTACPYKGEAWYFNITVKGKKIDNAVWYYMYPTHESAGVMGFFSFYNREGVDIIVDGVKLNDSGNVKPTTRSSNDVIIVPANDSLDIPWDRRNI